MTDRPNSPTTNEAETLVPDAGRSLEGTAVTLESLDDVRAAVEQAFDYRGDVTLRTRDGRTIEGYLFDRRADVDEPYLRIMPREGGRLTVPYADITELAFTGRDTAAGKSWETWVKKYVQKKLRGERASIESEALE